MDNAKTLDIFESLHDLLENAPSFFLKDLTAEFQENSQVESVSIVLHHIDIRACLDRLVKTDRVRAAHHSMDFDLLVYAGEVLLAHIRYVNHFTGVDLLAWVDCGSDGRLSNPFYLE